MCVLVVEDGAALRRMVVNYFEENSIRALAAEGRKDTARQLRDADVNLVILDLRLGQETNHNNLKSSKGSFDRFGDNRHKQVMSRSLVSGRKIKPTTKLIDATAIGYQSPA